MRRAALVRLLLASALLLWFCAALAAAKGSPKSRQRSARNRVSVGPQLSKSERAALRARHDAGWSNATLTRPCGAPPRGYDPPQWRREPPPSRRVAMRGWLVCTAAAPVHTALFALPPPAWPTRDEAFSATFKGKARSINLSPADGVARLTSDVDAADWIPLASFSYDAMPLPGEPPLQAEAATQAEPPPPPPPRDDGELRK